MSSLWTPGGERPVGGRGPSSPGASGAPGPQTGDEPVDEQALADEVRHMREQLARSPVEVVVANHCYGLFELSAVYLSQDPPLLDQARLAIDALACLVDGLTGRLGEAEPQLRDGLSQLRLAYVQIDGAERTKASASGGNGTPPNEGAAAGEGAGEEAGDDPAGAGDDG